MRVSIDPDLLTPAWLESSFDVRGGVLPTTMFRGSSRGPSVEVRLGDDLVLVVDSTTLRQVERFVSDVSTMARIARKIRKWTR